jgi:hypothetical protein
MKTYGHLAGRLLYPNVKLPRGEFDQFGTIPPLDMALET